MRHNCTQVPPRHRWKDSNCYTPSTTAALNYARALIRDLIGFFSGTISVGQFHPFKLQRALPWLQLLEGLGQNLKKGLFLDKFWLKWAPSTSAEKINNCPISYSQQVFVNNSQSLYCEFICRGLNWKAAPKTSIKIATKYSPMVPDSCWVQSEGARNLFPSGSGGMGVGGEVGRRVKGMVWIRCLEGQNLSLLTGNNQKGQKNSIFTLF